MSEDKDNNTIENIEEIYPLLTLDKIKGFLNEYDPNLIKSITIKTQIADLSDEIKNVLKQVFITKILKTNDAIKARFLQYFEIAEEFNDFKIVQKNVISNNFKIDLIIKQTNHEEVIWVLFFDYLDKVNFSRTENIINELTKKGVFQKTAKSNGIKIENQIPDEIYCICGKLERELAIEKEYLLFNKDNVKISFFIEFNDPSKPFEDRDLIIIDDLRIRGFNFGSTEHVLNLIKKLRGAGQFNIKTETTEGEKNIIWEGILFPKKLLSNI